MRWGLFQTGEIKESEPSDIDNYEIGIFLWSLLLVPVAYFWHPWFRVRIEHCSLTIEHIIFLLMGLARA